MSRCAPAAPRDSWKPCTFYSISCDFYPWASTSTDPRPASRLWSPEENGQPHKPGLFPSIVSVKPFLAITAHWVDTKRPSTSISLGKLWARAPSDIWVQELSTLCSESEKCTQPGPATLPWEPAPESQLSLRKNVPGGRGGGEVGEGENRQVRQNSQWKGTDTWGDER